MATSSASLTTATASASLNWFLVATCVMISIVLVAVCVLLVIKFGHPDDTNMALFPKMITVMGLFLSFGTILALPLDVANGDGAGGGLRMDVLWQGIFVCIIAGVTVVLPYAFFFYESDNNPERSGNVVAAWGGQAGTALQYTLIGVIILGMIFALMKLFFDTAEIPLTLVDRDSKLLTTKFQPLAFNTLKCIAKSKLNDKSTDCNVTKVQWSVQVSFLVFCAAMLAFLGWFFFTIFCGIGFVSLPFDMINEFRTRPIPMSAIEYAKQKIAIGKRASGLLALATELQKDKSDLDRTGSRKNRRNDRASQNRLEAELHALKKDKRLLEESYFQKGGNPVWYFSLLLFGLIGVILSLTWVLHICYYVLPKTPDPFLNNVFIEAATAIPGFSLFGVVLFGIYSFYLILCAIKGTFRLGLRVPWIMKIYPMELGNTMMNAFLFNTWLILICTIPVVQFCVLSFKLYARNTDVRAIFGTQVFYLKFFRYIWANSVFIWAMFCISFLTGVSLIVNPKDKASAIEQKLKELAKNNDVE